MARTIITCVLLVCMTLLATAAVTEPGRPLPRWIHGALGHPRIGLGVDLQGGVRFRIRATDANKSTILLRSLREGQDNACLHQIHVHTYHGGLSLLEAAGLRPRDSGTSCIKSRVSEMGPGVEITAVRHFALESGQHTVSRVLWGVLACCTLLSSLYVARYRWWGLVGMASLLLFVATTTGLLGLIQLDLTLPALVAFAVVLGLVGLLIFPLLGRSRPQPGAGGQHAGDSVLRRLWHSLFVRSWLVLITIGAATWLLAPGWWRLGEPLAASLAAATVTFLAARLLVPRHGESDRSSPALTAAGGVEAGPDNSA